MREVSLKLPENNLRRLQLLARDEDVTVGQIVREAVETELRRRSSPPPPEPVEVVAPTPTPAPAAASADLALKDEFVQATGWHDLARRLRERGLYVAERGDTLEVKHLHDQSRLCSLPDLLLSYDELKQRFNSPLPGPRPLSRQDRVFASVREPDPAIRQNGATAQ